MSYKRIPSALHNFAHSFVSLTNYVNGEYIIDILPELLKKVPGHRLSLEFPSGEIAPKGRYPENFLKSIEQHAQWYKNHFKNEGVELSKLRKTEIIIFGDIYGFHCRAEAEDCRGKIHKVEIQ